MRTVRQVTASPVPPGRKVPVREATAGWIDEMLAGDLATPRKQRHTARRIFERLAGERDAQVSYSYATMAALMARLTARTPASRALRRFHGITRGSRAGWCRSNCTAPSPGRCRSCR
jgi:hypothetical protein